MSDPMDINDDTQYDVVATEPSLADRMLALVRNELEQEIREQFVHTGKQAIIGGLYTEWANHHYRREGGITDEESAELRRHTDSLTELQKLDVAIEVVTRLFGPLDALSE